VILLLNRNTVRATVLAAMAFLAIGIAAAAFDNSVEGRVVIGVSEPLFHYLQPYYATFHEKHPGAVVEFRVIGDRQAGDGRAGDGPVGDGRVGDDRAGEDHHDQVSKWPLLDAIVIIESSLPALQSSSQPAGALGLVARESFCARFTPVVSAFNPTETITSEELRMALAGEISDWASIESGWSGEIRFLTWDTNPADHMVLGALADTELRTSSWAELESCDEVIRRLRLEPMEMAIIPLSRVSPGVNPVRITDGVSASRSGVGEPGVGGSGASGSGASGSGVSWSEASEFGASGSGVGRSSVSGSGVSRSGASGFDVSDGHLVCHAHVLEQVDRSPWGWIRDRFGGRRVLRAFIEHIREVDAALSGAGAVTLVAVGDVMMDRGVRLAMNQHGITYPFEGTQQVLASGDIAIANLETPISARGTPLNMFRAYPDVMKALRYSGIDVVSIANNHILDYDYVALTDTLMYLEADGIIGVGAGSDESAARRPAVIDVGGTRIAFLAYTELWFCYAKDNRPWDATATRAGVSPLREDILVQDIARAAAVADLVVVSCHWGDEYKHYPNQTQRRFAELAVRAGADIVLGHHPHVLQGIACDEGSVVAYSLGNFVFDQRQPGTQDSVILRFTISAGRIIRLDLLPCYIADCQPVLLTGEAKKAALMQMSRYSATLAEETQSSER
jgi:poly-gamma-glutamate capsule biosynthesis protein CapA/YwtB (metallophosphatase superfamily)